MTTVYHYNALFGRLNYNWKEKYLLNLTARRDGSSRFGPGRQFGNFGAVGAGWIFSKEKWLADRTGFLSFGKLRASYGTTGNDQIADYQYLPTYTSSGNTYQGLAGLYPTRIANPDFGWELLRKLEGGIELGFLHDKIMFTASLYENRTGNQLVGYRLPVLTGFTSVQANLPATVQNTGMEYELNTVNIRNNKFSWTSSFNISIPKNKLVAYPNIENSNYANVYTVGKSLFSQTVYHYTGVDANTGLYTFAAKDGTTIPSYPDDLQPSKPITQQFFGGFLNTFHYKGFSIDIFLQFVKQYSFGYLASFNLPGVEGANQPEIVMSRWQKPGDKTNVQRFTTTDPGYTAWASIVGPQ